MYISSSHLKYTFPLNETESLRIDKWLWAARFFKTRKLASEAVSGGKVHINDQRCKPSKEVRIGTRIFISKDQYSWNITVTGINKQRRPACEATLLYEEDEESFINRQQHIAKQKEERALQPQERQFRPNKKQRRQIHRFKQN